MIKRKKRERLEMAVGHQKLIESIMACWSVAQNCCHIRYMLSCISVCYTAGALIFLMEFIKLYLNFIVGNLIQERFASDYKVNDNDMDWIARCASRMARHYSLHIYNNSQNCVVHT